MGLKSWLLAKLAKHEAGEVDTPAKAEGALTPYVEEWHMGPKLEAGLITVLGGALSAAAQALQSAADPLSPAGLKASASAFLVGALIALAALLRQSPIPPKDGGK